MHWNFSVQVVERSIKNPDEERMPGQSYREPLLEAGASSVVIINNLERGVTKLRVIQDHSW